MEVSLEATTSRKISGQAYLEDGVEQGGDLRAERRMERMEARSRRKIASRPGRWGKGVSRCYLI